MHGTVLSTAVPRPCRVKCNTSFRRPFVSTLGSVVTRYVLRIFFANGNKRLDRCCRNILTFRRSVIVDWTILLRKREDLVAMTLECAVYLETPSALSLRRLITHAQVMQHRI